MPTAPLQALNRLAIQGRPVKPAPIPASRFFQVIITSSNNAGTHPVMYDTGPKGVTNPAFENRVPVPASARQRQNPATVSNKVKALAAKAIASFAITNPPLVMGRTAM